MRRHHCNRIDVRAFEQRLVIIGEFEFLRCCEWRRHLAINVAAGHHFEARALSQTGYNLLAPPAEPDNADLDHGALLPQDFVTRQCGA